MIGFVELVIFGTTLTWRRAIWFLRTSFLTDRLAGAIFMILIAGFTHASIIEDILMGSTYARITWMYLLRKYEWESEYFGIECTETLLPCSAEISQTVLRPGGPWYYTMPAFRCILWVIELTSRSYWALRCILQHFYNPFDKIHRCGSFSFFVMWLSTESDDLLLPTLIY